MKRDWPLIGLMSCLVVWGIASVLLAALQTCASISCRDRGGVPVNEGADCVKAEKVPR
jgi:hypothetical protein